MVKSAPEHADLRERLKTNPEQTLAEEFDRHRDRLWKLVRFRLDVRLVKRIDADDVLQDAWIAAAKRIDHFVSHESYSMFVWLRLIVGQTMVELQRHHLGTEKRDAGKEMSIHRRAFPMTDSVSIAAHLLGSFTSPSQIAVRDKTTRKLEQAIDEMDAIDRDVLTLRHFEELTNSEVAEVLQIEQKAASIRYVRALKRLKQILKLQPDFHSEVRDD